MAATLRSLLADPDFRLEPVAGFDDDAVLDEPIAWVHNSELIDPTPWLEPGQLLLIDGLQFVDDTSQEWAAAYVGRLQERGVLALGFATGITHDAIPPQLVRACADLGFPLIEVGDRAPFIAIIRKVADVISAEQRQRLEWSSSAQRAVARAALRPDGLGAVLRELEDRLECWVALYDAAGARIEVETSRRIPEDLGADIEKAVMSALERGTPSAGKLQFRQGGATLQTLGRGGRLRGILAVGIGAPLDTAENDLVSSVIGLASIALEQSTALETARLRLRAGVFELLLSGSMEVAGETVKRLWGRLPQAPVRIGLVAGRAAPTVLSELELYADRSAGRVFFSEREGQVVIVMPASEGPAVEAILLRRGLRAGFSAPVEYAELTRGMAEAHRAVARTSPKRPFIAFETVVNEGVVAFLEATGAETLARRLLEPVLASSSPDHEALLKSLEVWLEHNGAWDPAARELNIHRHTLRNRLHSLEELLGVDLRRFADRAELWAAMQLVDYPGKQTAAVGLDD